MPAPSESTEFDAPVGRNLQLFNLRQDLSWVLPEHGNVATY